MRGKVVQFNWILMLEQLGGEYISRLMMKEVANGVSVYTIRTRLPDGAFIINDSQEVGTLLQRQEEDVLANLDVRNITSKAQFRNK